MEITHEKYFLEYRKSAEVLEAFKSAYDTYVLDKTTKFGLDKDMNKYVKGFELAFYHHGELIWEPIIFNIETGKKKVEYEKMGLTDEVSLTKYLNNKHNAYKVLETFCLFFHDGKQNHEFLFNSATHYPQKIIYDAQAVSDISAKLNEAFFIKPFADQLELDLGEKIDKKHKPKI
jgi:hypothetical protein